MIQSFKELQQELMQKKMNLRKSPLLKLPADML